MYLPRLFSFVVFCFVFMAMFPFQRPMSSNWWAIGFRVRPNVLNNHLCLEWLSFLTILLIVLLFLVSVLHWMMRKWYAKSQCLRKCIAKGLCQGNYQGPTNISVLPVGNPEWVWHCPFCELGKAGRLWACNKYSLGIVVIPTRNPKSNCFLRRNDLKVQTSE